jgi:hypothetical protein
MNRYIYSLGLIIFLLGFYNHSFAQNVKVEAKLDTTSILLGDQTKLQLSARLASKDSVTFPKFKETISEGKILIVEQGDIKTIFDKDDLNSKTVSQDITITSFDAGGHAIPEMVFHTQLDSFKTQSLVLNVQAIAVDTTKAIYDIKQPLAVSYTWIDWLRDNWHWVILGLLLIAIIGFLIYYFKNRPKNVPVKDKPAVFIPAHILALEKLQELKSKRLWESGLIKDFYSELSDILREYLEGRYHIHAMEHTTAEIFKDLKNKGIKEKQRHQLREVFVLADLVKFAKEKPIAHENENSLETAIQFVKITQETQTPEKGEKE